MLAIICSFYAITTEVFWGNIYFSPVSQMLQNETSQWTMFKAQGKMISLCSVSEIWLYFNNPMFGFKCPTHNNKSNLCGLNHLFLLIKLIFFFCPFLPLLFLWSMCLHQTALCSASAQLGNIMSPNPTQFLAGISSRTSVTAQQKHPLSRSTSFSACATMPWLIALSAGAYPPS